MMALLPRTMNLLQGRSALSIWERADRTPERDADRTLNASERNRHIGPDPVDEASEESFPASDAPAWTTATGSIDGVPHASGRAGMDVSVDTNGEDPPRHPHSATGRESRTPAMLEAGRIEWARHERLRRYAFLWACGAASMLVAVYIIVLTLANSLEHATTEFLRLKYWMTPLVLGFSLQVGLFAYARGATHGPAIQARGVAASGSTNTLAMIACCAHHLTDVLPLIGLAGAALFLSSYQSLFLLLGVLSNVVGVVYVLGILKRHRLFPERHSVLSLTLRWPVDRALYPVVVASAVLFISAAIFVAG